jgi:beta-glucosidase
MAGRTYRYFEGEPLYPFGYGLSYTHFSYGDLRLSTSEISVGEGLRVEVAVTNSGGRAGDEVVQLYLRHPDAPKPAPLHALRGFRRVHLQPDETQTVVFELDHAAFELVDTDGERVLRPGRCQIFIGGGQPGTEATTVQGEVILG